MKLIELSKQRLQGMREDGWNSLFKEVYFFVQKTILLFPIWQIGNIDDLYQPQLQQKAQSMKNSHHCRVELLYYIVMDMQL
jgi:hypothetical protein